jgi:hypothetical protein
MTEGLRAKQGMAGDELKEVSVVEAKLNRMEELAEQISAEAGELRSFWADLARRLEAIEVEAWSNDLLESSEQLLFENTGGSAGEEENISTGAKGLQFGFGRIEAQASRNFLVRPASVVHGATLYGSLDAPEPNGSPRLLSDEPEAVRLAALHQLPELLDALLGSLNDTLAVVRTALGTPLETRALVSSPFSKRGGIGSESVVPITPGGAKQKS